MSSKYKTPTSARNPRKRLTENASASRIAEANEVWHSTAIDELEDEDVSENVAPPTETPVRGGGRKFNDVIFTGPEPKVSNGKRKEQELDSGRGRSATRGESAGEDLARVVINPPSGHAFLSSVLQKCGYIIRQPVTNNEMYKDAIMFRKSLSDWMGANDDQMSRIETEASKFQKALDVYLLDKQQFISATKPTKHDVELIQPSLLHCLLGIEALQAQVLKVVFLFLGEASLSSTQDNVSLVSTILNQLKWLPTVVDAQKFADSMLSIIDNASHTCQSILIKVLPDILPSSLHSHVAEKLLDKFSDEGSCVNIALLDCFSAFDIPDGSGSSIRTTAIDQMANAPMQDIPAYFSFLFRGEKLHEVNEVITAIREKVTLSPPHQSAKTDAQQAEILEKQIKFDLQNDSVESIKKIDLMMLFIFAEAEEAKAIAILKLLFAERTHMKNLFDQFMQENRAMVNLLFKTISNFLDKLLRSRDVKCLDVVTAITVKLFVSLSVLEAQTLMGNLTSILVNFPPSRDTVLQILTTLAETAPSKLLIFAPYLMGVLEYVMQFPAGQIRSLMNVLAIMSQTEGRNPGDSNHFAAEFSILLRKQLTHSDIKIRCFGVYGALASIRRMCAQDVPDNMRIRDLLKLAWEFVERDEDACSIFLDELSTCVHTLPYDICRTYRDKLKEKFQQLWTIGEIDNPTISQYSKRNNLNLRPLFDANKECTQDRLVINFEDHPMSMSPLVVPAHLRVLALLEAKVEDNDLVGIDAILGSPILFPDLQEYYERDSINDLKYNQRYHLGHYLILAINFFRESVCAFVEDANVELRVKVWLRLDNILKLQKLLVKHFDFFPTLPQAYTAEKTIGSGKDGGAGPSGLQAFRQGKDKAPPKPAAEKPVKKTAPKKSAKKKARTEVSFTDEEDEANQAAAPAIQKKAKLILDEEIQPKKILPFLRRFDESVFALLRYSLRTDDEAVDFSRILLDLTSVSQNSEIINKVETFTPETLILLLTELRRQVQGPQQHSSLNILKVKKIFKYVVSHMHQIQTVLLRNEENDMADITEYNVRMECCLRLLIDIMNAYFETIIKLDKEEKEKYIQRAIRTLAAQAVLRNSTDGQEGMGSQTEVMANVASYLGGFVSVIKDSSTALDHLKLLRSVHDLLEGHSELKKAIDSAARVYLRSEWKLPSAKVDGFLKVWLGTTKHPIKIINHLVEKLLCHDEDEDEGAEAAIFNNTVYKSCTSLNFQVWYTALLAGLSQYVYRNLRKRGDFDDSIKDWTEAVGIFKSLVSIAQKECKSKSLKNYILVALLKHCRLFLESFISGGAELLPNFMKQDKDAAQKFCKGLQVPCRIIQHICEHSKIHKDLQLLKSVPLVKRVLETLVFRVREVLGAAGAANAFWMGALKHRDLKGDCISSQIMEGTMDSMDWSSDEEQCSAGEDEDSVQVAPLSGMTGEDIFEDSMDAPEQEHEGDILDSDVE